MTRFRRRGRLPFLFALVSSVWADYYIDDTNTTLTYSSGPKAAWAPYAVGGETLELLLPNGTYQVIDAFVCWNHTYRCELAQHLNLLIRPETWIDAACFDTDVCLLTVPFTGTGITIYVYQAGPVGINASIDIDGAHAQTNVLNAPPAPAYEIANVSMFDVQQLSSGPHTLHLLINDLSGSYSGMMFDYAYVNESLVTNTTATTTSALATAISTAASTSTSAPSHSSASRNDTGAIVGGVVGMIALIVLGVLAFLWMRRRRRHEMIDLHSDSVSSPFRSHVVHDPLLVNSTGTYDPYTEYSPPANNAAGKNPNPSRSTDFIPLVPNRLVSPEVPRAAPSTLSSSQDMIIPFTGTSSTSNSSSTQKTRLTLSNDTTNIPTLQSQTEHSLSESRQEATPLLTDEQADFINSLHQNNVPAAAIARVVERMLADRHAGIREWERETRLARTNTMTTAPPSYDLVAERE